MIFAPQDFDKSLSILIKKLSKLFAFCLVDKQNLFYTERKTNFRKFSGGVINIIGFKGYKAKLEAK